MENKTEDRLLQECHTWLWNSYPDLRYCTWHVANERRTTIKEGALFKAKGVVSGVPDYVVNYNGKTYYFEMKIEKGVLSENQKKLSKQMKNQGFDIVIIRNFESFETFIKKLLCKQ